MIHTYDMFGSRFFLLLYIRHDNSICHQFFLFYIFEKGLLIAFVVDYLLIVEDLILLPVLYIYIQHFLSFYLLIFFSLFHFLIYFFIDYNIFIDAKCT